MIDNGNDCCQSRLGKKIILKKNKKKLQGAGGGDLLRPVGRERQERKQNCSLRLERQKSKQARGSLVI